MTIETQPDVDGLQRIGRVVSAQDEHTMIITGGAPAVVTGAH